tara:strand:+ start:212 stop:541 length:330 start_codon:yes stop_codon:yes gene_type:complete
MAYVQKNNPFPRTSCGRRRSYMTTDNPTPFYQSNKSPFEKTYATDAAYVKQRDKGNREYEKKTGGKLVTNNDKGRKSYCARSKGQLKMWPKAAKDPNSGLRRARRKWGC